MDVAPWAQWGPVALFCGTMLGAQLWFMRYLITISLPKITETFAAQLKEERDHRLQQHAENRIDRATDLMAQKAGFDKIFERVERAESVFAKALQDTRHRIINVEMGLQGVLGMVRQIQDEWREQQRRDHLREQSHIPPGFRSQHEREEDKQ